MIVKVQISLTTTEPTERCLIYNEARDWQYEGPMEPNDPLYKLMKGRKKAFFHALPVKNSQKSGYLKNNKGKPKTTYTISIGQEARWQEW